MRARLTLLAVILLLAGCIPAAETSSMADCPPPVWPPSELRPPIAYSYTVLLVDGGVPFEGWVELSLAPADEPSRLSWHLGGDEGGEEARLPAASLPGALLGLGDESVQPVLRSTLFSPLLDRPVTLALGHEESWSSGRTRVTRTVERLLTVSGIEGYLVHWTVREAGTELEMEAVLAPGHPLPLLVVLREKGVCTLEVRLRSTW